MNVWRKHPLGLFALIWALCSACSLWMRFDAEGQSCSDAGTCLEGYFCEDSVCRKVTPGCNCEPGFRCENEVTCVPGSCAVVGCPVGLVCTEDGGRPLCRRLVAPELGHSCQSDSECQVNGADRVCYFGAIPTATGRIRPGICLERCGTGGSCATVGAVCQTFWFGRDAGGTRVCAPEGLVRPCRTDPECLGDAPACTVFDHNEGGPISVCDKPLAPAAAVGAVCALSPDAGTLCANGLCTPQPAGPGQKATCGELCDTQTCAQGICTLAELKVLDRIRHVPLCVAEPSACRTCLSDTVCSADAPRCSPLDTGSRCLSSCTPAAGSAACPPGTVCVGLDGGSRCVPQGGVCP
jgi:hypothetical protein